ncbi:TonB-linked SusC/RagA family outer membrane protein [Anseongella ginsenosidimutans]|uniref:TonB-linked SusC/RagA family outer membrane protein n=1 Tax=Anseongella ginsenosidimutans TaxID=496056 RepID=A0A4R3KSR2_9SPHI|nr:TonB-dependent receptor [Anseongella ginsenosidimutans]QEC53292.1 TonB-dependent receptor [Anseongella ginsenosidimutans]TCS88164.1 TonB-linked SusC/RagA family outer membrane protein [Anseongella ginsenosidimutans]
MEQKTRKWMCICCILCTSLVSRAQEQFSGTVRDSISGTPLPGVSVNIRGGTSGTATDSAGNFVLAGEESQAVLVFSFLGYTTREISARTGQPVNVKLAQGSQSLDEVVVVGYGTQRKVNLTGAVGTASGEVLENRPIANVGEGLQGVIPNLNITPRNGDPSQSIDFNIRGYESINGGSPLILVDGVPMDLNRVNPSDIESISVLKDASAAAVYGARAAFGVVLVETKSGQAGKVKISLNTQWSLAKPIFNMDPVTDPYEVVTAWNQANMRTNGVPRYDEDMVAGTKAWSENPQTAPEWAVVDGVFRFYGANNYQDKIMTDAAPTNQHDLTISGGSENANYYVSFGYLSKDGYLRYNNEEFKRYNILMKGEFKINDWLTLDEKIVFNAQNSDKPHFYNWDVNINSLARVSPIMPVQFPDLDYYLSPGDREQYEQYIGMYFGGTNFFPYLLNGGRSTFTNNDTWLTSGATLTPVQGLKVIANFSYNIFHRNFQDVASKVDIVSTDLTDPNPISNGFSGDDWIDERTDHNQYYVLNTFAEYTYDRLEDHYFKAMVGYNQEWGMNKFTRAQARSLINPSITDINATTGTQQTFGNSSHVSLRGAFYRLNYIYKDKYLLETNGRYDGTSRFPKEDRFGFFPSVSFGWRISNENFLSGAGDWLNNLKIRASYGTLGNQLLGDDYYPYIATLGIGTSPYIMDDGLIPYVSAPGLVSPTLTWETVVSQNIGLDITLLNSRLDASFDVYTRETKDMLMDVEYPDILGTDAPQSNAADLKTTGWELALTWRDKINQDWNYNFTLSLSDWTAEITRYDNPTGALSEFYVGQKLGDIWGYETVGIFQSEEEIANAPDQSNIGANWKPGDIRYADLNGDGVISAGSNTLADPGDRKIIGNENPRYSFGVNAGAGFRGFRLSAFFQGYWQRDHWPTSGNWTWFFPFNAGHIERYFITDSWSEDNRDAYFAAPHISTNDKKNIQTQSRFLQNAGYIRLKNIMLSYDLPAHLLEKAGLGQARIYFTGMNLWEYSPIRKPLDPESIQNTTFDTNGAIEYPLQRIYSLGLSLTF